MRTNLQRNVLINYIVRTIWVLESDNKYLAKTDADTTYAKKSTVDTLSSTVSGHTTKIGTLESDVSAIKTKNTSQDTEIANIKNGTTVVGKASQLATARDISLTGDATGSASFNGSANASIAVALKNVGTAGTYSVVTTDAKGRVTSGAQVIEVGTAGQTNPSSSLAIGGIFFKEI